MSTDIADSIEERLSEVQKDFDEIDQEIAELAEKRNKIATEKKRLERIQKILTAETNGNGRSGGSGRQVDYPELLAAVEKADGPVTSRDLAEYLETTPIMISRKLVKLVDDGALTGNKTDGYVAVAGATVAV